LKPLHLRFACELHYLSTASVYSANIKVNCGCLSSLFKAVLTTALRFDSLRIDRSSTPIQLQFDYATTIQRPTARPGCWTAASTNCRRAATTIYPRPLLPLWALKHLAPPSRPRLETAT